MYKCDFPFEKIDLPDGDHVENWVSPDNYTKTYYVDQNHVNASDNNPGSEEMPFMTIQRAAQFLKAGEQVFVKNGLYREWVRPTAGGDGPGRSVRYSAYPGHDPVIRASKQITDKWIMCKHDKETGTKIWKTELSISFFDEWSPVMMENLTDSQFYGMGSHFAYYYENFRNKEPYNLRRSLLFIDNERSKQVKSTDSLCENLNSYFIEDSGRVIHISADDKTDPNDHFIEISHRPHCFGPVMPGLNYIVVSGFTMEHAGNGFAYPMSGAITPNYGHHWIIENNTIRDCNGAGIDVGVQINRPYDFYYPDGGGYIIRGNNVINCGFAGILGSHVENSVVEFNTISGCCWHDTEMYYENGAIKFLHNRNVLVRGNRVFNIRKANAIWMDWACINCRVTSNLTYDISSMFGSIFIEASRTVNSVDNNVIWNIEGNGIYQHDCDDLLISHNFIGKCSGYGVKMWFNKGRNVLGKESECKNNKVFNNLMFETEGSVFSVNDQNKAWGNVISQLKSAAEISDDRIDSRTQEKVLFSGDLIGDPNETAGGSTGGFLTDEAVSAYFEAVFDAQNETLTIKGDIGIRDEISGIAPGPFNDPIINLSDHIGYCRKYKV